MITKENLITFEIPQCQVAFLDLTKIIYLKNFVNRDIISIIKKIESLIQKRQVPLYAFIRNDLLCNDYFYNVTKAVIISKNENFHTTEERFTEYNQTYSVSILTRPSSGKIELEDRFEFSTAAGFMPKKSNTTTLSSQNIIPMSTFNLDKKGPQSNLSKATIVVEDSDRDSEDEMEADSNF